MKWRFRGLDGRRVSYAVVLGGLGWLAVLLVLTPARFVSPDDAKYFGIGTNLLAGRGATTAFGGFFPFHSPLWPAAVVFPRALFGVSPLATAHILEIVSVVGITSLAAVFGWRVTPLAGALTVVALLGVPYLFDLGRGHGLDAPASVLALAYVLVAARALERGLLRVAFVAGLLLALAFLVKESALPFAPVPILVAILRQAPWSRVIAGAGAIALTTLAGVAWWFLLYASETGRVYRLETPAWTMIPLAIALGATAGFALLAPFVEGRRRGGAPSAAAIRSANSRADRSRVAWLSAFLWFAALVAFFAFTRQRLGETFLSVAGVAEYIEAWAPELWPIITFAGIGTVLALGSRRARREQRLPIDELLLAAFCGLPLVLLVVSVGETPRHYVAELALLAAIGAAGWAWLLETRIGLAGRWQLGAAVATTSVIAGPAVAPPSVATTVMAASAAILIGLAVATLRGWTHAMRSEMLSRGSPGVAAVVVTCAVVVAGVPLAQSVRGFRAAPVTAIESQAVQETAAWIRANVADGAPVAFGALLAYETAFEIQDAFEPVQIREYQDVSFDPSAPLGLVRRGKTPTYDWLILMAAPRRVDLFYGYEASSLVERLRVANAPVWIHAGRSSDDRVGVVFAALEASGLPVAARLSWPLPDGDTLEVKIFHTGPQAATVSSDRLYMTQGALERFIDALRAAPAEARRRIAQKAAARVVVTPDRGSATQLVDELGRLSGD